MSYQQLALSLQDCGADTEEDVIGRALFVLERRLRAREVFSSPSHVQAYLRLQAQGLMYEVFNVLYLDAQNRMIAFERLFRGTLTQTSVYPREVVLRVLAHHAAGVILHHNHPSGSVQPSRADEHLTQTIKAALALVDCRVLDHVITSDEGSLSMAEKGLF